MYPTISDLLADLFGLHIPLPIQTFGFFVAISFFLANYTGILEIKRKEKNGLLSPFAQKVIRNKPTDLINILLNGLVAFFIGYKLFYAIFNYGDFVDNPQEAILSMKGNMLGGFGMAAWIIYSKFKENKGLKGKKQFEETVKVWPHELLISVTMIAAISGILGAKIFHNLENFSNFLKDPIGALMSFDGLTFYGGLICAIVAIWLYLRSKKLHFIHFADALAPGLMLAYGSGRIGCHLAGDGDWGIVNLAPQPQWMSFLPDWTWSFRYAHNVIREGIPIPGCVGKYCMQLEHPVFPTPFYEVLMGFALFGFLWAIRKRISTPGVLFSIYLIVNGIERFMIEKIRVNPDYDILGGITQAEIISALMILTGIICIVYFRKNKQQFTKQTDAV